MSCKVIRKGPAKVAKRIIVRKGGESPSKRKGYQIRPLTHQPFKIPLQGLVVGN
jgi:hypothetical protein